MRADRRSVLAGAGALGLAGLGGCSGARVIGLDKARRTLDICNQGEPRSLDPHSANAPWETNIIGNMFVGLTTENEKAEPVPGMAESWTTSADGRTWTFNLRRAQWSDGEGCDAHDFAFAFQRMLDPANLFGCAPLLYPIKNAEAVHKGAASPHELGVAALDDITLEIQLEHPAPYLPHLLKHHGAYPLPKHRVARYGGAWAAPGTIVVNGAFVLRRWLSNYIIHLERNPAFFDADAVAFEHLYFYPSDDANATARRVIAGEAAWSTRFQSSQAEALRAALPGFPRVAASLRCDYFLFNATRAPFNDMRLRQALTMAYDREFVAASVYRTGEAPAFSLVPPGAANYPAMARYRWAGQALAARRQEAERLLRAAGFGPNNPLRIEFMHRNTGDTPRIAAAAQSSWRAIAPWVGVELRGVEAQLHAANLRARNFDCCDDSRIAEFNDAKSLLLPFETRSGGQICPGYANPDFDRLMQASDVETDAKRRGEIMTSAEQILLDEAPLCMSVFANSANLVHPDLTGYADNLEDIHRARWFGIRQTP